jgi:hypothetical protein
VTTRRRIIAIVITLIAIVIATAISCGSSQNAPALTGTWTGSYICSQGDTGLRLVIRVQGQALTGTFSFYPLARNPGVPSGEYTLTGTDSATRTVLKAGRWITRPSGYELVGLTAGPPADNGTVLRGRVSNPACSTFSVRKS